MDKYQFHYFWEDNTSGKPDYIKDLNHKDDLDAFVHYDYETEYLQQVRSSTNVLLVKNGQYMATEYLQWCSGENLEMKY